MEDIVEKDKNRISYQKIIKEEIKNNLELYNNKENLKEFLNDIEQEVISVNNELYIISSKI